jgi:hypothetical protein
MVDVDYDEAMSDIPEHSFSEGGRPSIPRWVQPREDEIPASVGVDVKLGDSDRAAVYLSRPASYVDALRFDMIVVRRGDAPGDPAHFPMAMDISESPGGAPLPDEFLRFGVEFADGRRVSNVDDDVLEGPPAISLIGLSGDSSGDYWRYEWYLWPLPKNGDLVFVCSWPACGIHETRTIMNGDVARLAARRAHDAWSNDDTSS